VEPIVLDRFFLVWRYLCSHRQLVLQSPARGEHAEGIVVHFLGVIGHKVRSQYRPLTLMVADGQVRKDLLDFAEVPQHFRPRFICLTLPAEADGFVVCGVARVVATAETYLGESWPPPGRLINTLRQEDSAGR
jgi:hypothetical protein